MLFLLFIASCCGLFVSIPVKNCKLLYPDSLTLNGSSYSYLLPLGIHGIPKSHVISLRLESDDSVFFFEVPPSVSSRFSQYTLNSWDDYLITRRPYSLEKATWIPIELQKQSPFHEITVTVLDEERKPTNIPSVKHQFAVKTNDFNEKVAHLEDSMKRKHKELESQDNEFRALRKSIAEAYKPKRLHPELFSFKEDFLDKDFLKAATSNSVKERLALLKKETETGIYSFNLFTNEFCRKMIEEIENFQRSGVQVNAPNSMNNYGAILDEVGFQEFLDILMKQYLTPFTKLLYPEWGGDSLDTHHGFSIQYKIGEEESLDFHMDSSEITLNVCLGKNFTGGNVFFNGVRGEKSEKNENFEFAHSVGKAILHVGQHWHGAHKIKNGERYNLILWMRSSEYRASAAEKFLKQCKNSLKDEL